MAVPLSGSLLREEEMTEKKYLSLLGAACLVVALLCMVALLGRQSRRQEQVETALLNSSYSPNLSQVDIAEGEASISLHCGNLSGRLLWWGRTGFGMAAENPASHKSLVFPVDPVVMGEFLSAMEEVRSLTVVSRKQDNLASFGLGEGQGVRASFGLSDGTTVSQILFGDRNYSGHRIYLKTPDSPVYQGQDQFYPWLTTSAKSWADMALVSQQLLGISGGAQVQRLTMGCASKDGGFSQLVLAPTQEDFSSKVSRLLSLRGGSLIHPQVAEGRPLLAEIVVDTGFGTSATLRVYQGSQSQTDQEISSYYLVPQYSTLLEHNGSTGSGVRGDGSLPTMCYGLEISSWTWDSILTLME